MQACLELFWNKVPYFCRRQHVLGPYFADFYCHELRLVIEVDGFESHRARQEHDKARDDWMSTRGLTVLRLGATLILDNMRRALRVVAERAKDLQLQSDRQ